MAKDLFSKQTFSYAKYRPTYPRELFEYIMGFVKSKGTAWDCGTGNGQAATVLAEYFQHVKATDISEKQLAAATIKANIEYSVSAAEHTPFKDNIFDLITVAQAYHWFNFTAFEKEARRVGKPGSLVSIWGYNLISSENQSLNNSVAHFYTKVVGPYWDAERRFVEEDYKTVPFNFPLVSEKTFVIESKWRKPDFIGYLNSWSAVQNFIGAKGMNPVEQFAKEIDPLLRDDEFITVSFPVFLKMGMIE